MEVKLNKYTADSVINALRHTASTRLPALRPIAFRVGDNSNVVTAGDQCEEDMTEFISNVSSMYFSCQNDGKKELYTFDKITHKVENTYVLSANEFSDDGIGVASYDVTDVIHTSIPLEVVVYFRYTNGKHTADDNEAFLRQNEVDTSKLTVINSRHCAINTFVINKIEDLVSDESVYSIEVMSRSGMTSDEVIKTSLQLLGKELQKML